VDTPSIFCGAYKVVPLGAAWSFDTPAASDPCSAATIRELGTVTNGTSPQFITRTWQATNTCGNTATCSQAVAVITPGDLNGDGVVDQSELNSVLSNYWGHSDWIYMTNPMTLGGGLFQFSLTNANGWDFTVLGSSNMVDWIPLPGRAYPVYQFVDPAAASNAPQRFYRLSYP
jgi:hypothetical protein